MLALSLPLLLLAGIWLGGHPEDLPGFAREVFVADHDTRVGRPSGQHVRPIHRAALTLVSPQAMGKNGST